MSLPEFNLTQLREFNDKNYQSVAARMLKSALFFVEEMAGFPRSPRPVPKNARVPRVSIEQKYQFYLKMVKLDEATMGETQRIEMRRGFFGAVGIILVAMREEVYGLPDEFGAIILDDMYNQVADFWNSQSNEADGQ